MFSYEHILLITRLSFCSHLSYTKGVTYLPYWDQICHYLNNFRCRLVTICKFGTLDCFICIVSCFLSAASSRNTCIYDRFRILDTRLMFILKGKMIRVSSNVHSSTTPFKRDSIGISTIKAHGNSNRKIRKQILKCNGQIDVQSSSPIRSHNQQKLWLCSNVKSNLIKRPSPFKEIQSVMSENSESDSEVNFFAGSKSCVTPSPSDLPKPPQNWMKLTGCKVFELSQASPIPHDFTLDTAILAIGNERILPWFWIIISLL